MTNSIYRGFLLQALVRHRVMTIVVVVTISLLSLYGITELRFNDDYQKVFRSEHPAYTNLLAFSKEFDLDAGDLIVIIEGKGLLTRENLTILRDVDLELQSVDDVSSVFSIFDARSREDKDGYLEPLFPDEDGKDEDFVSARKHAADHPLLNNVILSAGQDAALFIVTLNSDIVTVSRIAPAYQQIQGILSELVPNHMRAGITGIPAIRYEVLNSNRKEQRLFLSLGLLLAFSISLVVFRRLKTVTILMTSVAVGLLWAMGLLGFIGEQINVVNMVLPTLLIVIGFSHSVHMVYRFHVARREGHSRLDASLLMIEKVGPACALATLTTTIAFFSLGVFSQTEAIHRFGITCAVGTFIVFLAVMILVPLLTNSRLTHHVTEKERASSFVVTALASTMRWISNRAWSVAGVSITVTLLLAVVCLNLKTDFRYSDVVPRHNPAYSALIQAEETFGGVIPLRVLVRWSKAIPLEELESILRALHEALAAEISVHGVFSFLNILQSLPLNWGPAQRDAALDALPSSTRDRLYKPERRLAVVGGYVAMNSSSVLEPVFQRIESRLRKLETDHPGYELQLTGSLVAITRLNRDIAAQLIVGLFAAALGIFVIMGAALRSVKLGLISIVPNVFPLVAVGALLVITGASLQFTGIMAFTICLGIAVDDTSHFLIRYKQAYRELGEVAAAVHMSAVQVGRAMTTTTAIFMSGFVVLLASSSPNIQSFGILSTSAVSLAFIGDVILLPALILAFFRSRRESRHGG